MWLNCPLSWGKKQCCHFGCKCLQSATLLACCDVGSVYKTILLLNVSAAVEEDGGIWDVELVIRCEGLHHMCLLLKKKQQCFN